jgi:hypothetical protein
MITITPAIVKGIGNSFKLDKVGLSVVLSAYIALFTQFVPFDVKFSGHEDRQLPTYSK